MRNGYILLHRQGITPEEWKTPERTLAWFDLLTMVDFNTGMVTINYTFYERRWRTARSTIHKWVKYWIGERMCERTGEYDSERKGERFFIVNYAKYQRLSEQDSEQKGEQDSERKGEPRYKVIKIPSVKIIKSNTSSKKKGPRPSVELVIKKMTETFGALDDSILKNRRYAWLLIQKAQKNNPQSSEQQAAEACAQLIQLASQHPFWGSKITKVETLFRNAQRIVNEARELKTQSAIAFIS